MKVKELLACGVDELNKFEIEDSVLKVRILLAYCIGQSKEFLVSHDDFEVDDQDKSDFFDGLMKLRDNVPIQYITNQQEFMKMSFYVDENVLIPRDDTEVLVNETLELCKVEDNVLDLCTGSGAIGISIKKYRDDCDVWLLDISEEALDIARKNAISNNCDVSFIKSDLFENVMKTDFDIIVSNPPYISKVEMDELDDQVKKEPNIALYGGEDGLDFYKRIASNAKDYLKKDGYLCLEIGYTQKFDVIRILEENGYKDIVCKKDLYGNDRVIIAKKED